MQHLQSHHSHSLVHPPLQHHHQNSLSHYPSPPNGHNHQPILQGSPANVGGSIVHQHWQQQLLKCEMVRSSRGAHHRARASAMASRTVTKSAIPITNPNKPSPIEDTTQDSDTSVSYASALESSPTVNHPSSTVGPVAQTPKPTASRSVWHSLDMGGVNIKNLPPTSGLFSFTFLINLYLNHNSFSSVPGEISKLRSLELLDLSGNALTTLPPELGLLTHLKELYIFDNHISTLPPELGTLHQLLTLGVEGNPLDPTLKSLIQNSGTQALISYLRDNCPAPASPPPREWKDLITSQEREALALDPSTEMIKALCFNILCERAATERMYGYTPSWALNWDFRRDLIMDEIKLRDCDIVCLQEVDIAQFEDFFTPRMEELGFDGIFWPKSRYKAMNDRLVDGCATFFRKAKYQMVEKHLVEFSSAAMQRQDFKKTDDMFNRVLGKDNIAIFCSLEHRESGSRLIVANSHITWDPVFRDVKLVQVALMVEELERFAAEFAMYPPRHPPSATSFDGSPDSLNGNPSRSPVYSDGTKIPLILCADLNSVPESGVYEFLANGILSPTHPDFMSHTYGKYTSEGLKHKFALKSAYSNPGAQLSMTNFTSGFQGALDYIWYSTTSMVPTRLLNEVDKSYTDRVVGFPNPHFPSDHISIAAEFRVKPPRENPARTPSFS
ncbi:glucose-repressible alcohol dehydrogenase transcriptional effector [Mycena floridula]|nr:glucose-repressible alcohol dehydrogenase transcriptional effector [Mycena floridula]